MTEAAKKVAEDAEHRFDDLTERVRERFDRILKGRFSDQVTSGRFGPARPGNRGDGGDRRVRPVPGGRGGHGAGQVRTDQHRRAGGGSR
ncbi:hypothetical protein ACGFIK_09950 [Micromonospora sp. NPDC048871]|uniref:hypothetical protein n=1 Tax=unclassified Micromonospora TaxID=2617518 RepID=UPI002E12EB00|nr:hypothetical protein OIE53_21960 [Micromonospora sp. NBC_01739]